MNPHPNQPSTASPITSGNFNSQSEAYRGWIIGHFIDPSSPFHTSDFELKWGNHSAGESKSQVGTNQTAQSLAILISGQFQFEFPDQKQTIILKQLGDYVYYPAGISHTWKALEDCLLLTLRWPSLPHDQQ